ncbi:MAG: hypothetical protein QOE90_2005 [Thermoplasmata archaeon]|nr:hypothetical protein [Thermoplasmata archaeon]
MISLKLKPAGKTALWIGGGALVGLAVGALLTNPDAAIVLAPVWVLASLVYVAGVFALLREKDEEPLAAVAVAPVAAPLRAAPRAPAAAPRVSGGLSVLVDLPAVPEGFPSVIGEREGVTLVVSVQTSAGPAAGAAVRLSSAPRDGARALVGEGVAGNDGTVAFDLAGQPVGELTLDAEARLDSLTGYATLAVSVVRYEEEIARLFGEFRSFAIGMLGPEAESSTARELAERLRAGADQTSARALLEIARVYELVAYGEREADRRLYLALMQQLLVLERADLPPVGPQAGPRAPPALPEV